MNFNKKKKRFEKLTRRSKIRWRLFAYDFLIYIAVAVFFLVIYPEGKQELTPGRVAALAAACGVLVFGARFFFDVYRQIWRYGSMQAYIRLIIADALGGLAFIIVRNLPIFVGITFPRALGIVSINLLVALSVRILYQYMYQASFTNPIQKGLRWAFDTFTGTSLKDSVSEGVPVNRIRIAIIGAGQIGVILAEELLRNIKSNYIPVCFVDSDSRKSGRQIYGLPVLNNDYHTLPNDLTQMNVQVAVIAIPDANAETKKRLYDFYRSLGLQVKTYDFPTMQDIASKRSLREYDIEELLFRTPKDFMTPETRDYYKDKVILVTGGGGSIGSEMCRQLARMNPKKIIVLDIYENGAYDLQQELKMKYGSDLDLQIEISTMCDLQQMDQIFGHYRPDIVIHAAAHKHVPLCQQNVTEAVKNNVFGTENLLLVSEKHHVKRFMMVSTDKAVNPTNVMGATKRMCEMMVLNHSGKMIVSATRFGNVLGSSGSVIPLFRRQIKNGGPITITDKRIIRYFMTIPEASQLVLTSGAMAKNRELYVLDMGKPVRILDLAESMICMSGFEPYKDIDIVEVGLRPGEKLYEELLIHGDNLTKTNNEMIFIEKDEEISAAEIHKKLRLLHQAAEKQDQEAMRTALREVVPTYHSPEEVNARACDSAEMRMIGERKIS